MRRPKKILIWIISATGAFVIILIALGLVAPRLINSEHVRERIEARISERVGGEVGFAAMEVAFFPMPRVRISGASLSVPGRAVGSAGTLWAYLRILPLLRGKVRIGRLRVVAPDLEVTLPEREVRGAGAAAPFRLDRDHASALLAGLSKGLAGAEGLVVLVEDGRFVFRDADNSVFTVGDVDSRVALRPDRLDLSLRCGSELWDGLDLDAVFDPASFKGTVRAGVKGLRTGPIVGRLHRGAASRVGGSTVDLEMDLTVDGPDALSADVRGSLPGLTLTGPGGGKDGGFAMSGGEFKGSVTVDGRRLAAGLAGLDLKMPRAHVTGRAAFDRGSGSISIELTGSDVDLAASREAALAAAGDIPLVRKTFRVLKGGRVARVTYKVAARKAEDLRDAKGYSLKARIEDGLVTIPRAGEVRDVAGEVTITRGVLEGGGLSGRLGPVLGRDTRLRYTLYGKDTPVSLETVVETDLRGLPELLGRVVKNEAFAGEVGRAEITGGKGYGRFFLDGTKKSLRARAEIGEFTIDARYGRVPYAISIKKGGFSYNMDRVEATGLDGSIGATTFTGLTARATTGDEPTLEIGSMRASVEAGEAYRIFSSLGLMKEARERVASVEGRVYVDNLKLKGPLGSPEDWDFETGGGIENLKAETTLVPGPLTLTGGSFRADRERVSVTGVGTVFLDGDIRLTAAVSPYSAAAPESVEAGFDGVLGPEAALWAQETARVPLGLRLLPPLSITGGRLNWRDAAGLTLAGEFSAGEGPVLSVDLEKTPEALVIKKLSIGDRGNEADITLSLGDETIEADWKGRLDGETLTRLLLKNRLLDGRVEGDFGVRLRTGEPPLFKTRGVLAGGGLKLPKAFFGGPLVEGFSVEGGGGVLRVGSAELLWMGRPVTMTGEITPSADGVFLDMDVKAGELEWEGLKEALKGQGEGRATGPKLRTPVASGRIRLETDRFTFGGFIWSGVAAEAAFSPGLTLVTVTEGEVCGVSTPGFIRAARGMVELSFSPVADKKDLDPSIGCVAGGDRLATGLLDLTGVLTSKGRPEELMKNATGNVTLSAENGRIHRFGALGKVFALLNVTEFFKGKFPDLAKEGFSYRSMKASLELKDGRLHLTEGMLDSASMEMAAAGEIDLLEREMEIKLLAAPLRSVDFVIKRLPVMGDILGGSLVTIPMRVSGPFDDPKVTYLSPKDIGSRLFGIMKRTLKAPVRIIEPVIPGRKEK